MEVDEYRSKILELLLNAVDGDGKPLLTEKEAKELSNEFSDTGLQTVTPFTKSGSNCEMLLDSGL